MINIENFVYDLKVKNEIWHASEIGEISYPVAGNNSYYDIEDRSFWFKYRNCIISEVLKKYSINGPIFDVGGGNGFVSYYLTLQGYKVVLVEPCIDGCKNGRSRGLKNIINSNFDTAHFYPNSIPNIGVFDVLEHIKNQHCFLETLQTNMITNGRLFITVPAIKSLWSEEDKQVGHFRRYRIKELHRILENYGFDVLYSTYFYSFLVIPIFLFRTIPSKLGFYKINTQKTMRQHLSKNNSVNVLGMLMKSELRKVKRSESIYIGSSLILVARKR